MAHVLSPDSRFWLWFYKKTPEEQAAFADAHDLEFTPRQLPVDPSNFVPPESELDPQYCDAMSQRAPADFQAELRSLDAKVEGFYSGHRSPHHLDREWFPPDVDITPFTCPTDQAAS